MMGAFVLGLTSGKSFIDAFQYSNAVVACYIDMPWHRMPSYQKINEVLPNLSPSEPTSECNIGMLLLPKPGTIKLSNHELYRIPSLVSNDTGFRNKIESLIKDILLYDWTSGKRLKSIILGAPSGTGKTTIINRITDIAPGEGIKILDYSDKLLNLKSGEFNEHFKGLADAYINNGNKYILLVVDEALKDARDEYIKSHGVTLLNAAHNNSIRFWFVDAGYTLSNSQNLLTSEITSRCNVYVLPKLEERLKDIPYMIASRLLHLGSQYNYQSIKLEGAFLLSAIEEMLERGNPRIFLESPLEDVFNNARRAARELSTSLVIKHEHLSLDKTSRMPMLDSIKALEYEILH